LPEIRALLEAGPWLSLTGKPGIGMRMSFPFLLKGSVFPGRAISLIGRLPYFHTQVPSEETGTFSNPGSWAGTVSFFPPGTF